MKCLTKFKGCCGPVPQRLVVVILAATGLGFVYVLRNSFTLALTQMTIKEETYKPESNVDVGLKCPNPEKVQNKTKTAKEKEVGEFKWSANEVQFLISAYFYGYVASHLPGGILGDLFGSKVVLNSGLLLGGICSLLTPASARLHYAMLFITRLIMGLGHGVIFPALATLIAKWSPPNERSRMSAISYSGIMFGSASGISLGGYILGTLPGWEPVFYIFGGLQVVWSISFYIVGYSSPQEHPFITDKEATLIEEQIAAKSKKRPTKIPFKKIFTSVPVIVFVLVHVGHSWLVFFTGVQLPLYMKTVLFFNIKESGVTSALPYLAMWLSGLLIGVFSDWTITHKKLSVTNNRKIFAILSNVLPVPFLIGASYAGCEKTVATALFTFMMFFKGIAYSSLKANAIDLSPNFAGILMAAANGMSSVGGLVTPYIVALFVKKDEATIYDWRKTFFFSAGVMLLFTIPYGFFASGNLQPWNEFEEEQEEETPTTTVAPATTAAEK